MTLPGVIRHNLGLKLVSLGLGSLVYFHVASNQPSERQVMIPIEVTRLPEDLALLTPPPERARVVFRGRGRDLLKLKWRSAALELNLSEAAVGRVAISPSIADIRLPRTSEITPVAVLDPRHLVLEVDQIAAEERPLMPLLVGTPPAGYWLRECRLEPARVMVRGPSQRIAVLDTLRVGPIDLRSFRSQASGRFPIERPDPRITLSPAEVEVIVSVERMASREVQDVSVRAIVDRGQVGIVEPARVGVRLSGPPDRLERLSQAQLGVVLDARGFNLGNHQVAARADTVHGVSVIPMRDSFRVVIEAGKKDSTEAGAAEIR
jgi:YbbR-like protein